MITGDIVLFTRMLSSLHPCLSMQSERTISSYKLVMHRRKAPSRARIAVNIAVNCCHTIVDVNVGEMDVPTRLREAGRNPFEPEHDRTQFITTALLSSILHVSLVFVQKRQRRETPPRCRRVDR